jgi:hypothetical protein
MSRSSTPESHLNRQRGVASHVVLQNRGQAHRTPKRAHTEGPHRTPRRGGNSARGGKVFLPTKSSLKNSRFVGASVEDMAARARVFESRMKAQYDADANARVQENFEARAEEERHASESLKTELEAAAKQREVEAAKRRAERTAELKAREQARADEIRARAEAKLRAAEAAAQEAAMRRDEEIRQAAQQRAAWNDAKARKAEEVRADPEVEWWPWDEWEEEPMGTDEDGVEGVTNSLEDDAEGADVAGEAEDEGAGPDGANDTSEAASWSPWRWPWEHEGADGEWRARPPGMPPGQAAGTRAEKGALTSEEAAAEAAARAQLMAGAQGSQGENREDKSAERDRAVKRILARSSKTLREELGMRPRAADAEVTACVRKQMRLLHPDYSINLALKGTNRHARIEAAFKKLNHLRDRDRLAH